MQPPLDEPLDMSMKTRKTQRVVINHDVDGGLEEHFRRSLCKEFYSDVDAAGVDAHFSRSLGSDKWKEIQRSNVQLLKKHPLPPPPPINGTKK